jgi:hypothetical protein
MLRVFVRFAFENSPMGAIKYGQIREALEVVRVVFHNLAIWKFRLQSLDELRLETVFAGFAGSLTGHVILPP